MRKSSKALKTLLVYEEHREGIGDFYNQYIDRLNDSGFDVEGFCITIDPPNSRSSFSALDQAWKKNNKKLLKVYGELKRKTLDKDVLYLYNGSGLHPEFLKELNTFNAYQCFDDPESSALLSAPVAKNFDACFVGNIASLNQYRGFGCKHVFFRPLGFFGLGKHPLTRVDEQEIHDRTEDIDACIFCERESHWRKSRLDYIVRNISNFVGAGLGWPIGKISEDQVISYYRRTKIGLNIHNSTGPINLRTYTLPANGVMQICDNKYHLGHIFELDKEVVGFQNIEEVPQLVNYYVKHDAERKKIAIAGWKRATRDYNEVTVWSKQMEQIAGLL